MARNRKSNPRTTNKESNSVSSIQFEELDPELLAQVQTVGRKRGEYDRYLKMFWESGARSHEVSLTEGPLAGKKPQTVKTGFEGASDRDGAPEGAAEGLDVRIYDDRVFLLRRDSES